MDRHKVVVEYSAQIQPYASAARALRAEIEGLNNSIARSRAVSAAALQGATTDFNTNLKAMKSWSTESIAMDSAAVRLGKSIERNHLTMSRQKQLLTEYRRGVVGARGAVSELAKEQVRMSRSQVNFWNDANGKKMASVSTPQGIDFKSHATQVAVARQEMQIYNRVLMQNAEATVNWGKNTQWAGRQIMVGLTIPLMMMGAAAKNIFLDVDRELTRMAKVYGSTVGVVTDEVLNSVKAQVTGLSQSLATEWGVAMKETIGLAADVAATGKEGEDLLVSTRETMRLSVLGEVDRQEALKTTLSLQSAFKLSNQELIESVNLLNAVENQTSTSLQDLTIAIPKAGPVVKALGGDVGDLAVMLVSMKEGGIQAAEGANAIKSGLASLINPTKRAQEASKALGVDLVGIVERNKGELMPTLLEFQKALMGLGKFERAQLIEKIFGKYQFARISALFENLNREGSQSVEAMKLNSATSVELAKMADKEMQRLTDSASGRWTRAVEGFKAQMAPIGEAITKVFTTVLGAVNKVLEVFNNLPDPVKTVIGSIMGIAALVGPILMIAGIFGNFIGQVMKGLAFLRGKKFGMFDMLTTDMVAANAATSDLVDAQFNEKNALLEINAVMETQIALLRKLASGQQEVADGANRLATTPPPRIGPPPPVPPGRASSTASAAMNVDYGNARLTQDATGLRASWIASMPAVAQEFKSQIDAKVDSGAGRSGGRAIDRVVRHIGDIPPEVFDTVGESAVGAMEESIAKTGAIDPKFVHEELQRKFPDGMGRKVATAVATNLYDSLEVPLANVPREIRSRIEKLPQVVRSGLGPVLQDAHAYAVGHGVKNSQTPGPMVGGHVNPHAERGQDAPGTSSVIYQPKPINKHIGDRVLTPEEHLTGVKNAPGLNAAMMYAVQEAGLTDQESLISATRSKGSDTRKAFVENLSPEIRATFETFVEEFGKGRVSIQALQDAIASLPGVTEEAAAAIANEVAAEKSRSEASKAATASERERVAAAKQSLAAARAANKAAYEAAQAEKTLSSERTKAKAAATRSATALKNSGTSAEVSAAVSSAVKSGAAEGARTAAEVIRARISQIQSSGVATEAQSIELDKLRVAGEKFSLSATKIEAAEANAVKASATNQQAAAGAMRAAEAELSAAKAQLSAAVKQEAAAVIEVAAGVEEEHAAVVESRAATTDSQSAAVTRSASENMLLAADRMASSFGGARLSAAPDPRMAKWVHDPEEARVQAHEQAANMKKPGGRLSRFFQKTVGQSMALGGAGMGIGMVTGNDAAMKFGELTMAAGMVSQAFEPLSNAAKYLKAQALAAGTGLRAMFAGGVSAGFKGLGAGIVSFVSGINPATIAIGALAAAAVLTYKAWENERKRTEARYRAGESVSDFTGVMLGSPSDIVDPRLGGPQYSPGERSQIKAKYSETDGYKSTIEDINIQRSTNDKIRILSAKFDAGNRILRTKFSGKELKAALDEQEKLFEIIAGETKLADEWARARDKTITERGKTLATYGDEMADRDSARNTGYSVMDWSTGQTRNTGGALAGLSPDNINLFQNDVAVGFKETVLAAGGDVGAAIGEMGTIANAWREVSIAGQGDFTKMQDKMKEGVPEFLWPAIDSANTLDGALIRIIDRMDLIPSQVVVSMNLVQGERSDGKGGVEKFAETPEQFEGRKATEYIRYLNGMTRANELANEVTAKINETTGTPPEDFGAAYDKRIEMLENADKAADKAHENEQRRSEERRDALNEEIDGIQKTIDAINEKYDAQRDALEQAKDIADFERDKQKSDINYYDAIARGDFVGAANIRAEQEQANADQQYDQAQKSIDDNEKSATDAQQARIDAIEATIAAIVKADKISDRAYEDAKERRQEKIQGLRDERDAAVKAAQDAANATATAEAEARAEHKATFEKRMANIRQLASEGELSIGQVKRQTEAAYAELATNMGWDLDETKTKAVAMANTLIDAYNLALKGVGIDPGEARENIGGRNVYYDKNGKLQFINGRVPDALHQDEAHTGTFVTADHTTGKRGLGSNEVSKTLEIGEYVVRKEAVRKVGRGTLDAINGLRYQPKMHSGGSVAINAGAMTAGMNAMQGKAYGALIDHFKEKIIGPRVAQAQGSRGLLAPSPAAPGIGISPSWGGFDISAASPAAQSAIGRAMNDFTNLVGMCLQEVRGWYGIPAKYHDASQAWYGTRTKHRDANPALGAPVFWTGGSKGYGHVAMYVGGGKVRSTDAAGAGRVATVPLSHWGGALKYQGWSEDLNGVAIQLRKGAQVKKDNVLANLHARETVLTSDLSSSLKRGINGLSDVPAIIDRGSNGGPSIYEGDRTINVTVHALPGMDVDSLADAMAARVVRAERRVGG